MKKIIKTLALMVFFSFALISIAFADVSGAGMFMMIGFTIAIYVAIAAAAIIAAAIAVKLIVKMVKNKSGK